MHPEGALNLIALLTGNAGAVAYLANGLGSDTGPCDPACLIDPIEATAEALVDVRVVRVSGSTVVDSGGQIERVETGLGIGGRVEPELCRANLEGGIVGTDRFRSTTQKDLGPTSLRCPRARRWM